MARFAQILGHERAVGMQHLAVAHLDDRARRTFTFSRTTPAKFWPRLKI